MQIYTNNYAAFRFKMSELSQLEDIMGKEQLNKSDALRMLFHIGIQDYYKNKGINTSSPGRGPAAEKA